MSDRFKRWVLVGSVLLWSFLSLACIKIGERDPVVTPIPPTATPLPPTPTPIPPTPTLVPDATPEVVDARMCRGLTDDERPFAETNTYSTVDPFMVSVQVNHLQLKNTVAAHWYYEGAMIGLTERDEVSGSRYIGLTLEPQSEWQPGDYSVEISLDGEIQETRDFAVIGTAGPSSPAVDPGNPGDVTWSTYEDQDLGFSIEVPDDWLVEQDGSAVQFTHPSDIALALVLVDAEPAADAQQEAEAIMEALSENLANYELTDSSAQDDGWHGIFFNYGEQGDLIDGILLSKIAGGRGYNLLLLVMDEYWDDMVPVLEQIWGTYTFEGGSGPVVEGGEIMIEGQVRDSDTGRGISDAVFVILKEGVSVDQFVDSGNDESLIYDLATSGSNGAFAMNLPVRQGASYEVFCLADGYAPVVDVLEVPEQAPNPWEVTVTMQKE